MYVDMIHIYYKSFKSENFYVFHRFCQTVNKVLPLKCFSHGRLEHQPNCKYFPYISSKYFVKSQKISFLKLLQQLHSIRICVYAHYSTQLYYKGHGHANDAILTITTILIHVYGYMQLYTDTHTHKHTEAFIQLNMA